MDYGDSGSKAEMMEFCFLVFRLCRESEDCHIFPTRAVVWLNDDSKSSDMNKNRGRSG